MYYLPEVVPLKLVADAPVPVAVKVSLLPVLTSVMANQNLLNVIPGAISHWNSTVNIRQH